MRATVTDMHTALALEVITQPTLPLQESEQKSSRLTRPMKTLGHKRKREIYDLYGEEARKDSLSQVWRWWDYPEGFQVVLR
jgi:hypothetical protein